MRTVGMPEAPDEPAGVPLSSGVGNAVCAVVVAVSIKAVIAGASGAGALAQSSRFFTVTSR